MEGNIPIDTTTKQRQAARWARIVFQAGLAALLLLLLSAIFLPDARALMEDIVHQIGDSLVRETAIYPSSDGASTVPSEHLTLEEAREAVDFEFSLPSEVPERYVMLDEVIVTPAFNAVNIRWTNDDIRGDGLWLRVSPYDPDVEFLVGPDGVETVQVNGRDAVFIRGGWLSNTESWDSTISREVRWVLDGVLYSLSTGNLCAGTEENRCPLTDEDLIRIAESVQ